MSKNFDPSKLSLIKRGGSGEKSAWKKYKFGSYFSSYEKFWQKYVVDLTNREDQKRDGDTNYKNNSELRQYYRNKSSKRYNPNFEKITDKELDKKINYDIHLSQLSYSVFECLFLCRHTIISNNCTLGLNALHLGMLYLCGGLDRSFELFGKFNIKYKNYFYEKADKGVIGRGRQKIDKENCRKSIFGNKYESIGYGVSRYIRRKEEGKTINKWIKIFYKYRNHFAHGHATPGIAGDKARLYIPKDFNTLRKYFDWKKIQNLTKKKEKEITRKDMLLVDDFLEQNWRKIIEYLDKEWKTFI